LDVRPFEHKVELLEAKLVEATQQVKRLDADMKAAEEEHKRVKAEADFAKSVRDQEYGIWKEKSTTERKWLDGKQRHEASVASVARSAQLVRQSQDAYNAWVGKEKEHTLIAQVRAQLAEAKLNVEYTRVLAPCDGIVTDLQLREGAYAHIGQAVLT